MSSFNYFLSYIGYCVWVLLKWIIIAVAVIGVGILIGRSLINWIGQGMFRF